MNVFDFLNSDEFDGVIRHIFTTAGGSAVVMSNFDPTQWQTIVGGVATVVGVLWSVASKRYLKNGGTPSVVIAPPQAKAPEVAPSA